MARYAELQICLNDSSADSYAVTAQFIGPGADADVDPDPGQAAFDFDGLEALVNEVDVAAYGALLTRNLFADPKVLTAFGQARSAADQAQVPLRVRLLVDTDAEELRSLRWETLRNPQDDTLLLTGERLLFSRYLRSPDWRPVLLRSRSELRALVVVANPADLSAYAPEGTPLQALDVQQEWARARDGLGAIPATPLVSRGQATLAKLGECLSDGYDILYLVCHGALVRDRPVLYLEDEAGNTAKVTGSALAEVLGALRVSPTLVVLASCQSAGSGARGALAAVGPLLARIGVPAVLAMQEKLTLETSGPFMDRFFKELGVDGQIDRAIAVARGEVYVRQRPDWWVPVLFTRLKSGCIWSLPRDLRGEQPFEKWDVLISNIRDQSCTPILGPGLIEFLLGSLRQIAQRWADRYRFPMAPHERADLPQVAQYLAIVKGDQEFPRMELRNYLEDAMRSRYSKLLQERLKDRLRDASLDDLITEVGRQRREQDESEPHRVLASLPLPIYISTNPDNLLAEALSAAKRPPQVELCHWKDDVEWPSSIYDPDRDPKYQPTVERPLAYHLFGQLKIRDSVVLTEDDYFDHLIGVAKGGTSIPTAVGNALTSSALLFLGFQVDDWNFRVLFRSIRSWEGRAKGKRKAHVAVQIDPEEGRSLEPNGARRYLEEYFQDADINIYWGSADEFIRELWERWKQDEQKRQWP